MELGLRGRRWLLPLVIAAAVAAAVSASVFVYYPATVGLNFQNPPIVLQTSSNTNQTDLGGKLIFVKFGTGGTSGTSVTIGLHPTYETTFYVGVLSVKNQDTATTYYVKLRVDSVNATLTDGEQIEIIAYTTDPNSPLATVTINSTTALPAESGWIPLGAGSSFNIAIKVTYPEGVALPSSPQGLTLHVIYSNQNAETPP